ncbi:CoA ester lyase (plasmid) [Cupriavidus pinatubonensis]|uniref:HpcH/HpaI aldolase/citrate lyase family protein n=1 Tax=Cupriavidus pinatubonensis TaxID=248026 RepID=UPI001C730600|nr:CoA ester lyase [Cupriavidus pinatubonensis]QYY33826.1 CoA ester lyase [Cupriavidus pinatubonensis]
MTRIARSYLFVPGHKPERFAKALASGAHHVVVDLEDAVAPADKAAARDSVASWLATQRDVFVRINAADTEWFEEDLRMLADYPGVGVMLPKADDRSLKTLIGMLPNRRTLALLETVKGFLRLHEIVGIRGLERIAFGSVDFSAESGISDEADALTAIRTNLVLASCYAGLAAPIDGVSVNFTAEAAIVQDARRSRQLGFGGKLCIHPAQVAPVNAAFAPSVEELEWARRVLDAFESSHGAATALDGKMIDKPVVDRARQMVSEGAVVTT